jgi:hypothetical protein
MVTADELRLPFAKARPLEGQGDCLISSQFIALFLSWGCVCQNLGRLKREELSPRRTNRQGHVIGAEAEELLSSAWRLTPHPTCSRGQS